MAKRGPKSSITNKSHPDSPAYERTRAKIQGTQLIKRLQCYALDQLDDKGNKVELDGTKIRAIEILIDRVLPKLSATEITGKDGGPVVPALYISDAKVKDE